MLTTMWTVILFTALLFTTYCNAGLTTTRNYVVQNSTKREELGTEIPMTSSSIKGESEITVEDFTKSHNKRNIIAGKEQTRRCFLNPVPAPTLCQATSRMKTNENICILECVVAKSNHLSFENIKNWAKSLKSSDNVHVHIRCEDGGRVTLRQPIKARALRSLVIRSCIIERYLDYDVTNETLQIPFTIKTLELYHNQMEQNVSEYIGMYEINSGMILDNYFCYIPPSLERYVDRNTRYIYLPVDINVDLNKFQRARLLYDAKQSQCEYGKLVYYEKSHTSESASDFLEMFFNKAAYMPKLTTLNFTHSLLTRLPPKIFNPTWTRRFPVLKMVDVSNNRMSAVQVPFGEWFYAGRKYPIIIDMSYNNVTSLSFKEINTLRSVYPNGIVKLYGNPFACNCELKDTLDFIQNNVGHAWHEYSYIKNMNCSQPLSLSGKKIAELNSKELCFGIEQDNVFLYVILSVLILGYFLILFMVKFKRELHILAHTRLGAVFKRTTIEDGKYFDAFVSYSSLDESWVLNMCKRLEDSPHHLNLCLHHKHFVPGACISDNIINSVENSRHTVVVLSKSFLQSEWCLLEFRKAFHQSLIERKRRIIIIMLENLSETDELLLTTDMKFFLQTHTYLWVSELLFWDKLIYSLSTRSTERQDVSAKWIRYKKDGDPRSDKVDTCRETVL